jgi:hypothetical protein
MNSSISNNAAETRFRCAIHKRGSSAKQSRGSLDQQEQLCREAIALKGTESNWPTLRKSWSLLSTSTSAETGIHFKCSFHPF